jgi:predicted enzyme related to lactoylglutathione lyase
MPRTIRRKTSRETGIIPIQGIDFVMYCTTDMRKTRAFYQRLFGLRRGDEWSSFWSEYDTSPLALCLNGSAKQKGSKWDWAGQPCVAFAVNNVEEAIVKCRKHGIAVLIDPVETSVCWMAWIADPSGNRICLHSRKKRTVVR